MNRHTGIGVPQQYGVVQSNITYRDLAPVPGYTMYRGCDPFFYFTKG